jgi:biotin carboxyl carrier protein
MKLQMQIGGRNSTLQFERDSTGTGWQFSFDGAPAREASVIEVEPGIYSVIVDGRSYEATVDPSGSTLFVSVGGERIGVVVENPRSRRRDSAAGGAGEGLQTVAVPMPGKVVRVLVAVGDEVEAGGGLLVVEAMKMQNEVRSPRKGRVISLKTEVGATVAAGDVLATIE